ncbi:hypothetical protein GNAINCEL_00083 [Serratia phage KKP 3709]|nr:hypothetical protein GNAINCEL_00083 [Serratia phage KKP 3709]
MSKLTNTLSNILDWAKARNLIDGSNSGAQVSEAVQRVWRNRPGNRSRRAHFHDGR